MESDHGKIRELLIKHHIHKNPIFDDMFSLTFCFSENKLDIFAFIKECKKYKLPFIKNFCMIEYKGITKEEVVLMNIFLCNSMPDQIMNIYIDNAWGTLERFKDSFPSLLPSVYGQIYIHRSYIKTQEMIKQIFDFSINCEELGLRYNHIHELGEDFSIHNIGDYKMHTLDLHLTYLPNFDDGSDETRMTTEKLRNLLNALSNTNLPSTLKLVYMYHDQNWEDQSHEEKLKEILNEYGFNDIEVSSDSASSMETRAKQ